MQVDCPKCKSSYRVDDEKVTDAGISLRCPGCSTVFQVQKNVAAPAAGAVAGGRIKVVVANESPSFCKAVQNVLAVEPFDVFSYNDGIATLQAIEEMLPNVVLLDVALPKMYGFEVCEKVKNSPALASVKIILIASIYDKTRYKREPKSLYNADAYIEKHHIPDTLVSMIYELVAGPQGADAGATQQDPFSGGMPAASYEAMEMQLAVNEAARQELKRDEERSVGSAASQAIPELPEAHVKARRLARIIVSDIALYNQDKVEEGIRNRTFYEVLGGDIEEGKKLYASRVAPEIQQSTAYLDEAFDELIAKKKKELRL